MTEGTSDSTKYTVQSFRESPDVVVGMFLDFLCLSHPPAIAHLVQMVLDLGTNPDPSLIMSSGFALLKVGLVGRVYLMQYDVDFHPVGIEPILVSLAHDAKGGFRGRQDRVCNRLPFSSKCCCIWWTLWWFWELLQLMVPCALKIYPLFLSEPSIRI